MKIPFICFLFLFSSVSLAQTLPEPVASSVLSATTAATGETNGIITSWTYTDGPVNATFSSSTGPTNLGAFAATGRYTATVQSAEREDRLVIFILDQGVSNSPPTIEMTWPENGSEFSAPIDLLLIADAQDPDGFIDHVVFFDGTMILGTSTVTPYSLTITNAAATNYQFYAQAVDNQSGVGTSGTNTVTVIPTVGVPPAVALTSPTNAQTFVSGSVVTLTAAPSNGISISNVMFYRVTLSEPDPEFPATNITSDLIATATSPPYSALWTPPAGSWILIATATDDLGIISTSAPPVTITVNPPLPPFVQITSPTNGATFTQGSTIPLLADASDQDGTITSVTFSQFQPFVFISVTSSSPYSGSWENVPAGNYSLVAEALDNSGLKTVSPAVSITITPTGSPTVTVDAGTSKTPRMSVYKTYLDAQYKAHSAKFTAYAKGDGQKKYDLQYVLDGTVDMYWATRDTNYINRALVWCEQAVAAANITDSNGNKNWSGLWFSSLSPSGLSYELFDLQGGAGMSTVFRAILTDPELKVVYGARATTIYNFVRDHIVNKILVKRNGLPWHRNFMRDPTSNISDKPTLMLMMMLNLKLSSTALGNTDNSTKGYPALVTEFAQGIKDYNGIENRFTPWKGGLVWSRGKKWQSWTVLDTSHAERLPAAVIDLYRAGQTFDITYVQGLANLLTGTIWDGSLTNPQFRNFIDGSNGPFLNRPPFNDGKIYAGWSMLSEFDTGVLNASKAMLRAINNGVVNPSIGYNNSFLGRTALAGHLARAVSVRENPPYAILNGLVTGSGTTATNWTHLSGPAGWTIVKPASPLTTVLFTPAAVGSHTFRLTVTSGGPAVSDDVGVTVLSAPAL